MDDPKDWYTKPASYNKPLTSHSKGLEIKSNESKRELFEKWFIKPLLKMERHDGFVLLYSLFPLYERHLKLNIPNIGKFCEGHIVFNTIGSDLSLGQNQAYHFWHIFRNGGLHSGLPDAEYKPPYQYLLQYHTDKPVIFENNTFQVNPLSLRDKILSIINNRLMWEGNNFPEVIKIIAN